MPLATGLWSVTVGFLSWSTRCLSMSGYSRMAHSLLWTGHSREEGADSKRAESESRDEQQYSSQAWSRRDAESAACGQAGDKDDAHNDAVQR